MKTHFASALSIIVLVSGFVSASSADEVKSPTKERIGIYDSRSIAVAYAGSACMEKRMRDSKARYQKAKERGDKKELAKIEAKNRARQSQLHKQGFSTAPVDDLLACIADELPRIQKSAEVTKLISKWDKAELAKHPGAEQVDLTMQLVDAFHPNERQRKTAIEIQKHKPISIEQAGKTKD